MSFLCRVPRRTPVSAYWFARSYASSSAPSGAVKKDSEATGTPAAPLSSCTPDTVLTGINYLKGQAPVVALADNQYPEWLWTLLQPRVWPDGGPGGKTERVTRRDENRRKIKDRNFMSTQ